MTVTNRPTIQKKNCSISIFLGVVSRQDPPMAKGDGGSATQKHRVAPLSDTVRGRKNSSTPVASNTTAVQLTNTSQPQIGIWLKGKKEILYVQSRHTLTRCGMLFRSTQMGQCNGFRNRLWQLVRIFTAKLVMEK
jgi:hypothetical protein